MHTENHSPGRYILYYPDAAGVHPLRSKPLVWSYWLHCLEEAAFKPHKVFWGGDEFTLEPGSFITSIPREASKLGLSDQNVRTARKYLVKLGMVNIQGTRAGTLVTVCKYSEFQDYKTQIKGRANRQTTQPPQTAHTPPTHCQQHTVYRDIQGKQVMQGYTHTGAEAVAYPKPFENFWNLYPKKEDKMDAFKLWKQIEDKEKLLTFAEEYGNAFQTSRRKYAKKAKYILRDQEWNHWLDANKDNQLPYQSRSSTEQRREDNYAQHIKEGRNQEDLTGYQDRDAYSLVCRNKRPDLTTQQCWEAFKSGTHWSVLIKTPQTETLTP